MPGNSLNQYLSNKVDIFHKNCGCVSGIFLYASYTRNVNGCFFIAFIFLSILFFSIVFVDLRAVVQDSDAK